MTEALWVAKVYDNGDLWGVTLFKSRESAMIFADERIRGELEHNELLTDRKETHANTHDVYSAFATDGGGETFEVVIDLMRVWP